jgi:hypothetical protein
MKESFNKYKYIILPTLGSSLVYAVSYFFTWGYFIFFNISRDFFQLNYNNVFISIISILLFLLTIVCCKQIYIFFENLAPFIIKIREFFSNKYIFIQGLTLSICVAPIVYLNNGYNLAYSASIVIGIAVIFSILSIASGSSYVNKTNNNKNNYTSEDAVAIVSFFTFVIIAYIIALGVYVAQSKDNFNFIITTDDTECYAIIDIQNNYFLTKKVKMGKSLKNGEIVIFDKVQEGLKIFTSEYSSKNSCEQIKDKAKKTNII